MANLKMNHHPLPRVLSLFYLIKLMLNWEFKVPENLTKQGSLLTQEDYLLIFRRKDEKWDMLKEADRSGWVAQIYICMIFWQNYMLSETILLLITPQSHYIAK